MSRVDGQTVDLVVVKGNFWKRLDHQCSHVTDLVTPQLDQLQKSESKRDGFRNVVRSYGSEARYKDVYRNLDGQLVKQNVAIGSMGIEDIVTSSFEGKESRSQERHHKSLYTLGLMNYQKLLKRMIDCAFITKASR